MESQQNYLLTSAEETVISTAVILIFFEIIIAWALVASILSRTWADWLQIFLPYHRYVFILKWLTLSLLAYAAVLFTVHVPWGEVALRTFWPKLTFDADAATVVVGVFGTTISPYLFFCQASEEVEDMAQNSAEPLIRDASTAPRELRRIGWDTWSG